VNEPTIDDRAQAIRALEDGHRIPKMDESVEWVDGRFGEQNLVAQKWSYVLATVLNGTFEGKAPDWHQVLVRDNPVHGENQSAVPADEFEPRWEEILQLGYGDWVNVETPRMLDGHLTIDVIYHGAPNADQGMSIMRRYRRQTIWIELYVMDPESTTYRFPYEVANQKGEEGPRPGA